MGSGSACVAALRTDRHFVGYDTDARYVKRARKRIADERRKLAQRRSQPRVELPAVPRAADPSEPLHALAVRAGRGVKEIARAVLDDCGFTVTDEDLRFANGVEIAFAARDKRGRRWLFDVSGAFTSPRTGLRRTETLWKALGKASILKASTAGNYRLVLLTTDLPPATSTAAKALESVHGSTFHDAVEMLSAEGQERLRLYASAVIAKTRQDPSCCERVARTEVSDFAFRAISGVLESAAHRAPGPWLLSIG